MIDRTHLFGIIACCCTVLVNDINEFHTDRNTYFLTNNWGILMHATNFFELLFLVSATICGTLGLVAFISPRRFARIAVWSSGWVDSGKWLKCLDRRFDIDRYVLRYSRILGILVILSASFLAYLYADR